MGLRWCFILISSLQHDFTLHTVLLENWKLYLIHNKLNLYDMDTKRAAWNVCIVQLYRFKFIELNIVRILIILRPSEERGFMHNFKSI